MMIKPSQSEPPLTDKVGDRATHQVQWRRRIHLALNACMPLTIEVLKHFQTYGCLKHSNMIQNTTDELTGDECPS